MGNMFTLNQTNRSDYIEFTTSANVNTTSSTNNLSLNEIVIFLVFALVCIVTTVFGNVLVTLSVFTYGPLKSVQNFFIVSLAGADLAVAVLVMPFNAVSFVMEDGDWQFGSVWCNVWLTLDILCCTASILHLCAIAIDRYYAIHDPINYAVQRTYGRVLIKIGVVWVASAVISIPPLFGWNNSSTQSLYDDLTRTCQLTDETSFVIYSASGSFYIPLIIMSFVYAQIYRATRARLRSRVSRTSKQLRLVVPSGLVSTVAITPGLVSEDVSAWVNVSLKERPTCGEVKPSIECEDESSFKCCELERGQSSYKCCELERGQSSYKCCEHERGQSLYKCCEHVRDQSSYKCCELERDQSSYKCCELERDQSSYKCGKLEQGQSSTQTSVQRYLHPTMNNLKRGDCVTTRLSSSSSKETTCTSPELATAECTLPTITKELISVALETKIVSDVRSNSCSQGINNLSRAKQRISLTKERRAARTMGIIMGAFVVCWLPFFLMYVILAFCDVCAASADKRFVNFIVWLGYVNSALNPIIYTIFNSDFRRAIQNLMFSRWCPATG